MKKILFYILTLVGVFSAHVVYSQPAEEREELSTFAGSSSLAAPLEEQESLYTAEGYFEKLRACIRDAHAEGQRFTPQSYSRRVTDEWYRPNVAFYRAQLSLWGETHKWRLDYFDQLNQQVERILEEGTEGKMSFTFFTLVTEFWTEIASKKFERGLQNLLTSFPQVWSALQDFEKNPNVDPGIMKGLHFGGSASFPIPFVSKTGIVPIPVMNQSWAFQEDGESYTAYWIAVASDKNNEFDGLQEQRPESVFGHDLGHASLSGFLEHRVSSSPRDVNHFASKLAHLYSLIERHEKRALLDLTMFFLLHETNTYCVNYEEFFSAQAYGTDYLLNFQGYLRGDMQRPRRLASSFQGILESLGLWEEVQEERSSDSSEAAFPPAVAQLIARIREGWEVLEPLIQSLSASTSSGGEA